LIITKRAGFIDRTRTELTTRESFNFHKTPFGSAYNIYSTFLLILRYNNVIFLYC